MEPDREKLQDLMSRYGFTEQEATAAYHLDRAQELFTELFGNPDRPGASALLNLSTFGAKFTDLRNELGRLILNRTYPEGWGPAESRVEDERSG